MYLPCWASAFICSVVQTRGMRKLALATLTSLLVSGAVPYATGANTAKAGSACTKVDSIIKVTNQTLKCIKSGNKLKWIISKVPTPISKPTTNDPWAKYGADASRFKAVEAYGLTLVANRNKNVAEMKIVLQSPNDPLVKQMTEHALFAYAVYESIASLGFTPKWVIGEQADWIKNQLAECPNMAAWLSLNQGGASCRMAIVWRGDSNNSIMKNTMLIQGGHEIWHLYQQELWGQNWEKVPDWVREGSANVGMSIISTHFDGRKSFSDYGAAAAAEMSSRNGFNCKESLARWEANESAKGFGFNNGCEYGLGSIMNEYLIMKGYTLKDNLKLIELIGKGLEFPAAFEQVYKMSTNTYFTELRAYLKTLNLGW